MWRGSSFALAAVVVACGSAYGDENGAVAPQCGEPGAAPCQQGCAEGLQDKDGDGTCAPACAPNACKTHESCDDASGTIACTCVVGYAPENGACVFRGGPLDPSFRNMPPNAWKLTQGATIDPVGPAGAVLVDPGAAVFMGAGVVEQSFAMPRWQDAEPLALELFTACESDCDLVDRDADLRWGDRRWPIANAFGARTTTTKLCLGERAFGRTLPLSLQMKAGNGGGGGGGQSDEAALVDVLRYVPDSECPMPGSVPNADFDGNGGWTTSGTGIAQVANGIGNNGTRGGRLAITAGQAANLTNLISVPEALPKPALTFSVRGERDKVLYASFAGYTLGKITGTGVFEKGVVCLPEWARGFAGRLTLSINATQNEVLLDDFAIATDAACPDAPWVIGGNFEGDQAGAWSLFGSTGTTGQLVRNAANAHSGEQYAYLYSGACSTEVQATQTVFVPAPSASGGPAVKFWYRATGGTTSGNVSVFGAQQTILSANAAWQEQTVCLPPSAANGPFTLRFYVINGTVNPCGAPRSLMLDDVSVTNTSMCPAQ